MEPKDTVKVVVRPNNRYGEAQAGTTLWVTQHELDTHPHCLRRVGDVAELPQVGRVHLPVTVARKYNFPVGEHEEGAVGYEVARLAGAYVPRSELDKALEHLKVQETLLRLAAQREEELQREIAKLKGKKA